MTITESSSSSNSIGQHVKRRLTELENERKRKWDPHWRDLGRHFLPRRASFLEGKDDSNSGDERNRLWDSIGIKARSTLSAGLQSGLTSPARPWFSITLQDENLAKEATVKAWLHAVYEVMVSTFARTNFYDQIHLAYDELCLFGTAVMLIEEDVDETRIRCNTLTAGEYCLDTNKSKRVDTLYRRIRMTPRHILEAWPETCPERIKNLAEFSKMEWQEVVHAIEPNKDYKAGKNDRSSRRFRSVYVMNDNTAEVLEESGFYEFPAVCPRWNTKSEEIYGTSPAMDALADCRLLQRITKAEIEALEKEVNPALVFNVAAGIVPPIKTSPGALNPISNMSGSQPAISSLYNVKSNLVGAEQIKTQLQIKIKEMFFNDLFLMISNQTQQMTAREVMEKQSEKMLLLGPVLDRLRSELFQPMIERSYGCLERQGLIPLPPEELFGQEIKIDFISILAQAQKQAGLSGINSTVGFIGQVAGMTPEAVDKINIDATIDEIAEMNGVPPAIIRSNEEVAQIRAQRQQMIQQQQQMQQMQQLAGLAQQGGSAMKSLAEASGQGQPGQGTPAEEMVQAQAQAQA